MTDARTRYEQRIEAARGALAAGDRAASAQALSEAIGFARNDQRLYREHADTLIRLAQLKQQLSQFLEAERLLTEALMVNERNLGKTHADLAIVLNELARLYLRQSKFARAEPLLKRLLEITRAKGEEHSQVASVLAGLAIVREGLGEHAAAEALYRRALDIREKNFAPNDMAIAKTLELLAETCAAGGKFGEALALFQRALPMRVQSLGADHASVTASRERIAELERNVADEARLSEPAKASAPPPDLFSPNAPASVTPPAVTAGTRPSESAREVTRVETRTTPWRAKPTRATPPWSTLVTQASLSLIAPTQEVAAAPEPFIFAEPAPIPSQSRAEESVVVEEEPRHERRAAVKTHAPSIKDLPTAVVPKKRPVNFLMLVTGIAAVLVIGVGGVIVGVSVANKRGQSSDAKSRTDRKPLAVATTVTAAVPAATPPAPTPPSPPAVIDSAKVGARVTHVPVAPPKDTPQPTPPEAQIQLPSVAGVNLGNIATTNVDSVVRAATAKGARESSLEQITVSGSGEGLKSSAYGDALKVATQPRMLGSSPQPRYPETLRSQALEGEVVVRFLVNESGRVDPSTMIVVRSPHDLFTAAVRNVLSQFRFDPARTAAPESKPTPEWVQYNVQFHPVK
jgi:TonB family protein